MGLWRRRHLEQTMASALLRLKGHRARFHTEQLQTEKLQPSPRFRGAAGDSLLFLGQEDSEAAGLSCSPGCHGTGSRCPLAALLTAEQIRQAPPQLGTCPHPSARPPGSPEVSPPLTLRPPALTQGHVGGASADALGDSCLCSPRDPAHHHAPGVRLAALRSRGFPWRGLGERGLDPERGVCRHGLSAGQAAVQEPASVPEALLPHQLPGGRALRGGAENRQHHQAEGAGERAGAALSVGLGESQRCRVGAGGAAGGSPVLAVPGGGTDAAAACPARPPGCGGQPQGGSHVVTPECPGPEAGATQGPAGQLLPGHGDAVLLLLQTKLRPKLAGLYGIPTSGPWSTAPLAVCGGPAVPPVPAAPHLLARCPGTKSWTPRSVRPARPGRGQGLQPGAACGGLGRGAPRELLGGGVCQGRARLPLPGPHTVSPGS
ncbi:interleukin-34 isoform X3 [Tamandua tetradactyla]|uniref:interleukin-34 isoform X3 n=1 Tax=Tamandua tetradactyla TaxID=48850 RepID=UPI004053E459